MQVTWSALVLVCFLLKENMALLYDSVFLRHMMVPSLLSAYLLSLGLQMFQVFPLRKGKKEKRKNQREQDSCCTAPAGCGNKEPEVLGGRVANQWELAGDGQGSGGRGHGAVGGMGAERS